MRPVATTRTNQGLQTAHETRRANLQVLIGEAGTQAALAAKLGITPAQVSIWVNASPDSRTGRPRGISDASARRLEKVMGKPRGWMDQPHHGQAQPVSLDLSQTTPVRLLEWDHMTSTEPVPPTFRLRLRDEAMAPLAPAGTTVTWDSTVTDPQPGDGVLVRDAAGALHVRRYRVGRTGWEAYPVNSAYRVLDSEADGLQLVAVWISMDRRLAGI